MLRIPLFLTEVQTPRRKRQVQGAKPNRKSRYREKAVLLVGSEQRHNRRTEKFQLVKYDAVDSAWTKCKDTFNRFKEDWGWLPLTRKSKTRSINMCCVTLTLPNFPLSSSIPGWSAWFSYKVQYLLGSLGNCRMQYQQIYIWCIWIKWTLFVSSIFAFTRSSETGLLTLSCAHSRHPECEEEH